MMIQIQVPTQIGYFTYELFKMYFPVHHKWFSRQKETRSSKSFLLTIEFLRWWLCLWIARPFTKEDFLPKDINRLFISLAANKVEAKLSNEQLEYLRQCKDICSVFLLLNIELSKLDYRTINKYLRPDELQAIIKQWNLNDFDLFLDLDVSIFILVSIQYSQLFTCRIGFLVDAWLK